MHILYSFSKTKNNLNLKLLIFLCLLINNLVKLIFKILKKRIKRANYKVKIR